MKKFLVFICFVLAFSTKAIGKETTYSKELFDKALSEGKVVVVSSWIKYCTSCASQMKVLEKAKNDFDKRFKEVDWNKYHNSLPFNTSALALYEWSPIAEELKTLDRKIVLNSMILKWDNIKKEFEELFNF